MYVPLSEKRTAFTVGAGKNFSTIQDSINFWSGKTPSAATTISIDAGTYAEALLFNNHPYLHLITWTGDVRSAAGQHFLHDSENFTNHAGDVWKLKLTGSLPADYGNGDYIEIGGATSAGNVGRFPLADPYISGQYVYFTNAAAVNEAPLEQTRVIFCPNRIVDFSAVVSTEGIKSVSSVPPNISGLTVMSSRALASGIVAFQNGKINCSKIAAYNLNYYSFYAYTGNIFCDAKCTSVLSSRGLQLSFAGTIEFPVIGDTGYVANASSYGVRNAASAGTVMCSNLIITKCTTGISTGFNAHIYADGAKLINCTTGAEAIYGGQTRVIGATAHNCTDGYAAAGEGVVFAAAVGANNSGNTRNYSLDGVETLVSGTEGTTGGRVFFS